MRIWMSAGRMVLVVAAMSVGSHTVAQSPLVRAFSALPSMQSPALSPDGAQLAFIGHSETGSYVFVARLDGMAVETVVDTAEAKPRALVWASDDTLVFTAGVATSVIVLPGQIETTSPYGIDLSAGAAVTQLLQNRASTTRRGGGGGGGRIGGFLALPTAQFIGHDRSTGRVLYPQFDAVEGERVLYAVDPKNDRRTVLDRGPRTAIDWVVDESGVPMFRADYDQRSNQFTLLAKRANRWEVVIAETVSLPQLAIYGLDDAGKLVVGIRPADVGRFGLYALSTETGKLGAPVFVHERYDVTDVRIDPYTNRVIGAGVADESPVWLDAELARHQALLDETFEGESPRIVSWSEDRNKFIVVTDAGDRAPGVYLYDAAAPSVDQIATTLTSLQGVRLPLRRPYSFPARDGTSIPGYLTRPIDADGRTPLVVLPHGGPATRDVAGFDWMAHFLASRGYTVLQPNFRGSGGYGQAWERAGYGQWGVGVMQHDLSDGVAALVAAGLADPDRVCIVGASYGGYAALAGAAFTPDLYRCAAAIAPVTDLADMLGFESDRRGGFNATVGYWRQAMGGGDEAGLNDRLRAASPAAHAERVEAPILLIHGREDAVVPLIQSQTMERALRAADKRVELVELDGEDHWLSGWTTRLAALQALDEFLAEHLEN